MYSFITCTIYFYCLQVLGAAGGLHTSQLSLGGVPAPKPRQRSTAPLASPPSSLLSAVRPSSPQLTAQAPSLLRQPPKAMPQPPRAKAAATHVVKGADGKPVHLTAEQYQSLVGSGVLRQVAAAPTATASASTSVSAAANEAIQQVLASTGVGGSRLIQAPPRQAQPQTASIQVNK